MTRHSEPLSLEQATYLDRPGTYNREFGLWENGGPWKWADPIQAIVSDSHKWRSFLDFDAEWGPFENRVGQSAIENLYRCGYALVKVLPDEDTPRIWEHQPGDRYCWIVRSMVGNETDGFRTEAVAYAPAQNSLEQAWRRGLRELDRSDDFNLGALRDGELVALLWHDHIVDDDPAELAEIAKECGL